MYIKSDLKYLNQESVLEELNFNTGWPKGISVYVIHTAMTVIILFLYSRNWCNRQLLFSSLKLVEVSLFNILWKGRAWAMYKVRIEVLPRENFLGLINSISEGTGNKIK